MLRGELSGCVCTLYCGRLSVQSMRSLQALLWDMSCLYTNRDRRQEVGAPQDNTVDQAADCISQ
jgi:hypothetical protein